SGPATIALQGGQVDLAFASVGQANLLVESGRAVPLGVTGTARDALAPDVPTIAEAGFPDFAIESWFGLLAPAEVPSHIIDKLSDALQKTLSKPDVQAKLASAGMTASPAAPDEF